MKRRTGLLALLLMAALFCGACRSDPPRPESSPALAVSAQEAGRLAGVQLGLLADLVTPLERERVVSLLTSLLPLRQARLESGVWEKSDQEARLIQQLNRLYERYTVKYLGHGGTWGYSNPTEKTLAEYHIVGGETIRLATDYGSAQYGREDYEALWAQMRAMLPEDAFRLFSRFTVFTDGPNETLAYVIQADSTGSKWEIAVDPADAKDADWFTETVLHEYCHALTLNDSQAEYTSRQTVDTYNEEGMVTLSGSYLDDFYQAFWTDTLDDRLANRDSYCFFLRHEDDFVTDYASTDPSEDIAESFTYFVLWPPQEGDAVWERKLAFFYDYPELVEFRAQVRDRLGLEG